MCFRYAQFAQLRNYACGAYGDVGFKIAQHAQKLAQLISGR